MKIVIGNDHTAYAMKKDIINHLIQRGEEVTDFGAADGERAEYPIYAERVANAVAAGTYDRGILICGTGIGMCLAANKVNGIRAALCSEPYSAKLTAEHNLSNILCLGARVIGDEMAKMIVDTWLDAIFQGGRHQSRVDMITDIEKRNRSI